MALSGRLVHTSRGVSVSSSRQRLVCLSAFRGSSNSSPQPWQSKPHNERNPAVRAGSEDAAIQAAPAAAPAPVPVTAEWLELVVEKAIKGPYQAYSRSLEERPLLTKAATSLVGFVLGDIIAQHMSHPEAWNALRTLRLGLYGLLIDGPIGAKWYDFLEDNVFPGKESRSIQAVLAKTALDQLVYATIMTAVYFAAIKTVEGHPEAVAATLEAKFWPTLAANYAVWPLAHMINFKFVAAPYRILYNNVVCIAWLTWLSMITHSQWGHGLLAVFHR